MKHGNIYPAERIETALNHFFRKGNLTALREMALRRTAEKTEEQLRQYMTEHGIERVGQPVNVYWWASMLGRTSARSSAMPGDWLMPCMLT